MHTLQLDTVNIHFNGDFYGEIEIVDKTGNRVEFSIEDLLKFADIAKRDRADSKKYRHPGEKEMSYINAVLAMCNEYAVISRYSSANVAFVPSATYDKLIDEKLGNYTDVMRVTPHCIILLDGIAVFRTQVKKIHVVHLDIDVQKDSADIRAMLDTGNFRMVSKHWAGQNLTKVEIGGGSYFLTAENLAEIKSKCEEFNEDFTDE